MQKVTEIFRNYQYTKNMKEILEYLNSIQDMINNKFYNKGM